METVSGLVEVAVPLPVHARFTWNTSRELPVGAVVVVPYGRRELVGWVVGPGEAADGVEIKPIKELLSTQPAFDSGQLAFFRWVADYYLCPLGEVIATALPSDAGASTRRVYRPTEEGIERLATDPPAGARGAVLREVVSRPGLSRTALERRLHEEVPESLVALGALLQAGLVEGVDEVVEGVKDQVPWVLPAGAPPAGARYAAARAVHARLPAPAAELPASIVGTLLKHGAAVRSARPRAWGRDVVAVATRPPALNVAQQAAIAAVGERGVVLVHGVTGSGKTEVYLALAARAVAAGRQVLVLVPEIALTPLLCGRFEGRFPGQVAAVHSRVAAAEKLRAFRAVREGRARVVVGARSALFAPFENLGLVVVDEEHDDSYKQDEGVRYNARDLAVLLASRAACPCVLGSATPSLESFHNATRGRYQLVQMLERATPRPVPTLEVIDTRPVHRENQGKPPLLAPVVHEALSAALGGGEKAILLHNRRGFATFVECPGCGGTYECPSCGVALVFHQKINRLDCHYCGFHRSFPGSCPQCDVPLELLGRGTERIESMIEELFPGVPVGRMDADTTRGKGAHARILDDFGAGRTRLLVGTQVVAKGHDFPDVTVAAVLGADHILGMPDFRSAERTWSLVTQLCGRAGRGAVAGRVFVQTQHPEHPVFSCIGNVQAFAEAELELRRMLCYPPYSSLVLVRVEAADRALARESALALARQARGQARGFTGVDVLGPAAAPMPRLVGRYRLQVVMRGRDRKAFRHFLAEHHRSWSVPAGVRRVVDVDPRTMM